MKKLVLATVLAACATMPSRGAVLNFNRLEGADSDLVSVYTEGAFTVRSIGGGFRKRISPFPNSPSLYNARFNNVLEITAGGGTFSFDGFSLYLQSNNSTSYTVAGQLGGASVFSYSASQGGTSDHFIFQPSASTAPVDRVVMTFNNYARVEGSSWIDDVGVTIVGRAVGAAVPEPGAWAMMLSGFGLMGGTLRARRRSATPRVA